MFLSSVECYKTTQELNDLDLSNHFKFINASNDFRRPHYNTLEIASSRNDVLKFSFLTRIVKEWLNLPKEIIDAGTLGKFRSRLKEYIIAS